MNAEDAAARDPKPPQPPVPPLRARGIKLGRIAKVPVYLNLSWIFLAVIVITGYGQFALQSRPDLAPAQAYAIAAGFMAVLFLSVLLHELGHALVARRFGIGVRSITLEMLGGFTEMETDSPSPKADLLVSLAGPAVSAVLGAIALGVRYALPAGTLWHELAWLVALSNLIVAAFNILPGLPLDGGRALRAAVWAATGDRHQGSRIAGYVGRGLALAIVALTLWWSYTDSVDLFGTVFGLLIALTVWQGANVSVQYAVTASRLSTLDLRRLARPIFAVPSGTPLAEAARRATEAGYNRAALGVTDSAGTLIALVNDQAAAAVPVERKPWVSVESVARTLDAGHALRADLAGEEVIRAIQANPAPAYLITLGGQIIGVMQVADLARLLNS
jgi:Zn-dependent protease